MNTKEFIEHMKKLGISPEEMLRIYKREAELADAAGSTHNARAFRHAMQEISREVGL